MLLLQAFRQTSHGETNTLSGTQLDHSGNLAITQCTFNSKGFFPDGKAPLGSIGPKV